MEQHDLTALLRQKPFAGKTPTRITSLDGESAGPLQGLQLLVVEDSPDNQVLLKRLLQRAGAEVTLAANGKEGVEIALGFSFDAVVMDLQMPVMDGISATKSLRVQGFRRPILALTAHGQRGDREKVMKFGFDEFLDKPIRSEMLIDSIARLAAGFAIPHA